jgi:hypothetical protein
VPVAAVLAQQRGGVPEAQVRRRRAGQVGEGGGERAPGGVRGPGGRLGQLGRLGHLGAVDAVAEQGAQGRVDAPQPGGEDVGRARDGHAGAMCSATTSGLKE